MAKALIVIMVFISCIDHAGAWNFLVLGDWGGLPVYPYHTEVEQSTANQMAITAKEEQSKFVVALGDNFYFNGVVDEHDKRFEETYGDVFNQSSLQVPWFVVAGNHDHRGNVTGQIEYTNHSDVWKFPSEYYSRTFQFEDSSRVVKLILIDTILLCGNTESDFDPQQPTGPLDQTKANVQWEWIEKELQAANDDKVDYVIVGGHFPVWSVAEHGPTQCLVDELKPMLEHYKASMYINGHDHNLQHIKESESNIDYFTIGCANFVDNTKKNEHRVPKDSLKFFWADIEKKGAFAGFNVRDDNMVVTYISATGDLLYEEKIEPRNF